jgi:hypothetical protein
MLKLFLYIVIAYLAYKIFINPRKLNPPGNRDKINSEKKNKNEDYTDYEEIS